MEQAHQVRTIRIVPIRGSQQARRLIQREERFVFVQHGDFPEFLGFRRRELDERSHRVASRHEVTLAPPELRSNWFLYRGTVAALPSHMKSAVICGNSAPDTLG